MLSGWGRKTFEGRRGGRFQFITGYKGTPLDVPDDAFPQNGAPPAMMVGMSNFGEGPEEYRATARSLKLASEQARTAVLGPSAVVTVALAQDGVTCMRRDVAEEIWRSYDVSQLDLGDERLEGLHQASNLMYQALHHEKIQEDPLFAGLRLPTTAKEFQKFCAKDSETPHLVLVTPTLQPLDPTLPPLQLVLKLCNGGKWHSQEVMFHLKRFVRPDYLMLMDVGAVLKRDALQLMLEAFQSNPQLVAASPYQRVQKLKKMPEWGDTPGCCERAWLWAIYEALGQPQCFEFEGAGVVFNAPSQLTKHAVILPGPCLVICSAREGPPDVGYQLPRGEQKYLEEMYRTLPTDADGATVLKVMHTRLAEDRWLTVCLNAYSPRGMYTQLVFGAYFLYLPELTFLRLMQQRRRWVCGTVIITLRQFDGGDGTVAHAAPHKRMLLKAVYGLQLYVTALVFVSPAIYASLVLSSAHFLCDKYGSLLGEEACGGSHPGVLVGVAYAVMWLSFSVITYFHVVKSETFYRVYYVCSIAFTGMCMCALFLGGFGSWVLLTLMVTTVSPFVAAVGSGGCTGGWYFLRSLPSYMLCLEFYIVRISSFAVARFRDMKWGTQVGGDETHNHHESVAEVTSYLFNVYVSANVVLMLFCYLLASTGNMHSALPAVTVLVFAPAAIMSLCSLWFVAKQYVGWCCSGSSTLDVSSYSADSGSEGVEESKETA